jgi:hypothetical protein
MALVVG